MIRVECQFCSHVFHVEQALAGQFVNCTKCGAQLTVPDQEMERSIDDNYPAGDRPEREDFLGLPSARFWAWTFRILAGFAILGLAVAVIWVRRGQNAGRPNPQPGRAPRAMPPIAGAAKRQPLRTVVRGNFGIADRERFLAGSEGPPVTPVPWMVVFDPPAKTVTIPPDHVIHIPIPDGPNPEIVFSATPSTMVSVGNVGHGNERREIWDFRANRRIGTTRGLRTLSENLGGFFRPISALSPDGLVFITQGTGPFDLVAWDVAAEKQLCVLRPEHAPSAGLTFAAFSRPDRLLACGFGTPFQMLRLTGQARMRMQKFPRETEYNRSSLAISPGGRYLAVYHRRGPSAIRFYDTESGVQSGQLTLPPIEPAGPMNCGGVVFSPDGREVAALFDYNGAWHLVCWDLHHGKVVERIEFGGNLLQILGARFAYLYGPLEWFPDRTRWLVYGQGIVDRNRHKLIWNIPDEPNRMPHGIRHVASADYVLSVVQEKSGFVLGGLHLPLKEIDRVATSP
jgi:hypothetical protein